MRSHRAAGTPFRPKSPAETEDRRALFARIGRPAAVALALFLAIAGVVAASGLRRLSEGRLPPAPLPSGFSMPQGCEAAPLSLSQLPAGKGNRKGSTSRGNIAYF